MVDVGDPGFRAANLPDVTRPEPGSAGAVRVGGRLRRVSWVFLLGGLGVVVVCLMTPTGTGHDVLYLLIGAASVLAIVAGVRLHRPSVPSAWYLMAAGQLVWSIGDGIGSWIAVQRGDGVLTAGDAFYLMGYPLVAAGLVQLIRARRPLRDMGGFLDSAILTVGLGVLVWALLAEPTLESFRESMPAAAVAATYPVADAVLLGLLTGLVSASGGSSAALRLLIMAVVVLIAADLATSVLILLTSQSSSRAIVLLWLSSDVLWGAAALHPSMRALSEPTPIQRGAFTRKQMAATAGAVLVAPGILLGSQVLGRPVDLWPVAVGSVAISWLVVMRLKVAIDEITAADRERSQAQAALAHQASHDTLTGLPNRARAVELIGRALTRTTPSGARLAVLFIDLDGFKRVNDTLGHGAGDALLRVVATRLRTNVRAGDVACRLGGDEFVVLMYALTDEAEAVRVADRLIAVLSDPVLLGDSHLVTVGASVGVALSQRGAADADALLQEADAALYRAKQTGRGRVVVFDAQMREDLHARIDLERELAAAMESDELILQYQPIVHLTSGVVQGYEALLRWRRSEALLPPAEFIPIAEQSQLICELGAWVLRQATQQLARWNERPGGASLTLAVNISGRHVSTSQILTDVREAVVAAGVDPAQLVLEITETALSDSSMAVTNLAELRRDGLAVGMDDFGTGYSSIARLERLPIDLLKVDRSFLTHPTPSSEELLRMIVNAGHALGLAVVVEGVETEEQAIWLRSIGCESAQGYHFGRPLDPDTITPPEQRIPPLVPVDVRARQV